MPIYSLKKEPSSERGYDFTLPTTYPARPINNVAVLLSGTSVEDERGRVVTTENDRYIQGQYCRLGKVLFCYEDKVLISGFDKKPHMVLADMAAMNRIRDRMARSEASERAEEPTLP